MKIAILSGKGGTGKTMVAVNLAAIAPEVVYLDCDVEEPNGRLFFQPTEINEETVTTGIPEIKADLCLGCRKCVDFCRFNALALIEGKAVLFPDVCHPCGACELLCSAGAIRNRQKVVGYLETGNLPNGKIYTGILKLGEESGVPLIRKLLEKTKGTEEKLTVIDCPPGSACVVMESIQDADYCLLVAEATTFGQHNLAMVYELATLFGKPCGVVLNKCVSGENPSEQFCLEHNIPILERLAYSEEIGKINGRGDILVKESEEYAERFQALLTRIEDEVKKR